MKTPDIHVISATALEFQGKRYRCAIGRGGFASPDEKREGDLKTPTGTYALRELWFRPDRLPQPACALPTRATEPQDGWCDDSSHPDYNHHILIPPPACGGRLGGGQADGKSGEGRYAQEPFSSRYHKVLENARELRKNLTDAEQLIWMLLRRKQLGFRFRRQYALGRYIVDFVCLEKQLVIELDGGQPGQHEVDDTQRDAFIQKAGFQVLRFWNHDVFENTQGVLQSIWDTLHAPTPALPRKQGRESLIPPPACGGRLGGGHADGPQSFELLWRDDGVYDLIIPLGYNDAPPVAGRGSAIFMHIAQPDWRGTEGCVALAKEDLLEILGQVTADSRMVIAP